ncbi:MAG: hydroxyacylglutathione hydrolase [Alphaproteobacteria bacterium]
MINVTLVPALSDNYIYLLKMENGAVAIVDPGEAAPILEVLKSKNLTPDCILNTHHHWDHVNGISGLQKAFPDIAVYTPENRPSEFGGERLEILETPGHTLDHICYHFPESRMAFTGDTLFSMGCGRLFEGTPEQMWESLQRIAALPDNTQIYCGHEYTLSNGRFCLSIEPENKALQERVEEVEGLRAAGKPTLPVSLALEKQTNIFLRAGSAERFAQLRALKDKF